MAYKDKNDPRRKVSRNKWYKQNKEKQIKQQLERRAHLTNILKRYKRFLKCTDCGMKFNKHPECCDFHHLDPTIKEGTVYEMICSSKEAFKKEIKKCIPLCANCHRIKHAH